MIFSGTRYTLRPTYEGLTNNMHPLVDIHCHLLPNLDDGAANWDESLAMARLAQEDGITCIVATAHQLGAYAHVSGAGFAIWPWNSSNVSIGKA